MTSFRHRSAAGEILAGKLMSYRDHPQGLVLALPRGGVPVAQAIARRLRLPLDVFIVRKLGAPGQEELALGAIASGGVCVLNDEILRELQISSTALAKIREREQRELKRREQLYRAGRAALHVRDRTIILVDDGIATGATMRAAIRALRAQQAARIVVAVPVAAPSVEHDLREADEVIAVLQPDDFRSVGAWFNDFSQVSDREVTALLADSPADRFPC